MKHTLVRSTGITCWSNEPHFSFSHAYVRLPCFLVPLGLLPYYYMTLADPKVSLEVDRCMYNNMFDNPECRNTSVPLVKNVHFTVCQKPWSCHKHDKNVRCNIFLDKWYELREEVSNPQPCAARAYCTNTTVKTFTFYRLSVYDICVYASLK